MKTANPSLAPLVSVRPSYGSENMVTFVAAPGAPASALTRPGTTLVIRTEATVNLQVSLQAVAGGQLDAELKLEPIDGTHTPERTLGGAAHSSKPANELELMAHVSRRGDVAARPGDWIAGPNAPSPIEGLAANWSSGHGQGLEYQVFSEGASEWSDWVVAGGFAGTRGQARAIVGLRFRIAGAGPYAMRVKALFLGAAAVEKTGQTIELRSASGRDPLVGLAAQVEMMSAAPLPRAPTASVEQHQSEPERRGRVRVFRATGEQN